MSTIIYRNNVYRHLRKMVIWSIVQLKTDKIIDFKS